jgi:predicted Zn finger-like uncharacterized protein
MRIVCPACSAAYEVPDALLGTGRPVRCARCEHEWMPADPRPTEAAHPEAIHTEAVHAEAPHTGSRGEGPRAGSIVGRIGELPSSGTGLSISVIEPPPWPAPETGPPVTPDPAADPGELVLELPLAASAEQARVEPRTPRQGTLLRLAWAASLLALVLLAWAAYGWRAEIMQAWPASEWLYGALGLAGGAP